MTSPLENPADDEAILEELLDRALSQLEDGLEVDIETLIAGREHLRERATEIVRLASRTCPTAARTMPDIPGYSSIREIGQGGMGTVYLARQDRIGGRPVALKVLPPASGLSPRARQRFSDEALAIGKLRHPNIVAIYDVIESGDARAYAMEWVDGATLAQRIQESASNKTPPDIAWICRIGLHIARALGAVHRAGLVHRDVKPSNILLRGDGTALLSDFGLVRETESSMTSQTGQFAGTAAYAAPEQLRGEHDSVDARSDVFSLGVTLFHALAVRLPFDTCNPLAMLREFERGPRTALRLANSRVPRDLETIVAKAMDTDPARRYQTADELADDLERLASFQPIRARRAGIVRRFAKLVRRNRGAAIGVAVGSVLSLALAASAVVYVFLVPRWAAAHVTNARLALLDPAHGNQIFLVSFFGDPTPAEPGTSPAALQTALALYDRALHWHPWDPAIRRERQVVQKVSDAAANPRINHEKADVDPHSRGLYALLTGDSANALDAWSGIEIEHDPDPLVAAAMGILYLADDEPGRAYLPLRDACHALPNVGFLTVYQADAAVQCGDLVRAARLLEAARHMPRLDPLGSLERVEADLAAAQGRVLEAERLYRRIVGNPISQFRLARLLESTGRLQESVIEYRRLRTVVPNGPKPREAFVAAADRWWKTVSSPQKLRMIRACLDEPSHDRTSVSALLRDYVAAARQQRGSIPPSLRPTFFSANRSPSLGSLSLSELAERLEVEDMLLWSRIASYPRILKSFQLSAWQSPWPRAASRAVQRLAILAAATTAFMASAGPTRGEVQDFDYNFEDLSLGNINDQDGWVVVAGTAWVQAGPGVNTSKTVNGPVFDNSQDIRPLPEPFHYTAADTAVVWSFHGLVGVSCCNMSSIVAFIGSNTTNFGLDKSGPDLLHTRLSAGPIYGDALAFAHWYEIRVTIDFSVAGGLATLAYRDLTLGEQTFRIDETLNNINLNASPDPQGRYTFHTVFTRQDSANGVCFVDNIHFDAPRPPCPVHTGDMNADTAANGRDIQRFVDALMTGSTAFADTCPGDFSDSAMIDLGDLDGFVSMILN